MAKKKKKTYVLSSIILCLVTFLIGFLSGFSIYAVANVESDKLVFSSSELQIHFLELGNMNAGDCIYIKAGDNDILIDAGSKKTSLSTIYDYVSKFVEDGVIEYGIVTHAHQDHYACYSCDDSLFTKFKYETLIDFAQSGNTSSSLYKKYQENIQTAINTYGMKHYTALDCINETNGAKRVIELGEGITLKILDSRYYSELSSDENNNSVCFLLTQGENNYLFTGDLEAEGEEELIKRNDLPKCVLYKAGHHGSKTSSSDALLQVIQPENVVVTCVAGSVEYTQNLDNTFPTQAFVDRISKYTNNVYVTSLATIEPKGDGKYTNVSFGSMNGTIVVYSNGNDVKFEFSNNDTKLKDTTWFKEYRKCPDPWK